MGKWPNVYLEEEMNTRAKSTAVHIWRIDYQGRELRTTSSNGFHVWVSWDDFVEVVGLQDAGEALSRIDQADIAELTPGKSSQETEGVLRLINEIGVYTLLALYPSPASREFKDWFLEIREYLFQVTKDGGVPGYTLQ